VKTKTEIGEEQAGFRQGRSTRDQITNLRILMHKAREHQQQFGFGRYEHITPVLRDILQWLPVTARIQFKIAVRFAGKHVHRPAKLLYRGSCRLERTST